jgi:hypothetical protein
MQLPLRRRGLLPLSLKDDTANRGRLIGVLISAIA